MTRLVQEELCEYAKLKLCSDLRAGTLAYAKPWTYTYWPSGECAAVIVEIDGATRVKYTVEQMRADTEGHARAIAMFRPGPLRRHLA